MWLVIQFSYVQNQQKERESGVEQKGCGYAVWEEWATTFFLK
jgi:hypothetical protein